MSKFQHHKKLCFIFSKSLISSLKCKSNFLGEKYFLSVDRRFCLGSLGFDFLHLLLSGFPNSWNIPRSPFLIYNNLYWVWMSSDSHYLNFSTFSYVFQLQLAYQSSPAVLAVSEQVSKTFNSFLIELLAVQVVQFAYQSCLRQLSPVVCTVWIN